MCVFHHFHNKLLRHYVTNSAPTSQKTSVRLHYKDEPVNVILVNNRRLYKNPTKRINTTCG